MAINYADKYSPLVDEAFTQSALTQGVINNSYDWIGVEAIKVFSIPVKDWVDYKLSGSNRYGAPDELENEVQSMMLTQDKSFTFTIDQKSVQDTLGTMVAGTALAREISQVVIPGIDTYRISKIVAGVNPSHLTNVTTTKDNAYETFLGLQEKLDDAKAPQGGRVAIVTPAFYNKIKLDSAFTKMGDLATRIALNGQIGTIDDIPVIKAPTSYFPAGVDVIITNPIVMPAPVKLTEYKIHSDAPGISGFLVEGRVRFDAFVLNQKKNAIAVNKVGSGE